MSDGLEKYCVYCGLPDERHTETCPLVDGTLEALRGRVTDERVAEDELAAGRDAILHQLRETEDGVAMGVEDRDREKRIVYEFMAKHYRDLSLGMMEREHEIEDWRERVDVPIVGHFLTPYVWWLKRKRRKLLEEQEANLAEMAEAYDMPEGTLGEIQANEEWRIDVGDAVSVPIYRDVETNELIYAEL